MMATQRATDSKPPWTATSSAAVFLFLILAVSELSHYSSSSAPLRGQPGGSSSLAAAGCALSLRESGGFICDSDATWWERQERAVHQHARQEISMDTSGPDFFTRNWEPNFSCAGQRRLGSPGDGGKWICDPTTISRLYGGGGGGGGVSVGGGVAAASAPSCVIYSIGSAEMFSFEEDVHAALGPRCAIHIFDHTVDAPHPPPFATFHSIGLGSADGGKLLTLASMRARLGHEHAMIEILKIDCECCEYDAVFPGDFSHVRQVLLEIHAFCPNWDPRAVHAFFNRMFLDGWVIFSKEPNTQWCQGRCIEYSFLKLGWDAAALERRAHAQWCSGGWESSDPNVPRDAYLPANMVRCKGWEGGGHAANGVR